ncbi:Cell division protein FtsI [Lachnospiraceae bacterium TWA4]|nr:Cell division protein FtsI [Lachnospiraceae bacterium TWA4]
MTSTDAKGMELEGTSEQRRDPIQGNSLYLTLDLNIQKYCQQVAEQLMIEKSAKKVNILVMNPQNGEVLAMVNVPEFDLNRPFVLNTQVDSKIKKSDALNQMWRNHCINDTYEPGSTFKIITMSAGLDSGVVKESDSFVCPGYKIVEDRRIRCHKVAGHGAETFVQGAMNSCNPVFIEVGARIGVSRFYDYFKQFGLLEKTGIDLPGEAGTIMHKKSAIGEVELATISFGQSFQLTPIRLLTTVSSLINGGHKITPHLAKEIRSADESRIQPLNYDTNEQVVPAEISSRVCAILEQVVSGGSGKNASVKGYKIGGKTATSEKLPRGTGKYISSFLGFSPTKNPKVALLITVDEPQGTYYGGMICAPVAATIFENILPYLAQK